MAYKVLRLDELEWSTPSAGDQSRGIVRLSDRLEHMRANIWRLPGGAKGRRHVELLQEEIFVVLSGTATMALGDPPQRVEVERGSVIVVDPGTAVQLRNDDEDEAVVLVVGAPPEQNRAEYLPDA
jgi:mannose-6-phosphate isomerase-like protein (cupin superfamily)